MVNPRELNEIVLQLEDMVKFAASDFTISTPDLRGFLSFLAKVAHVVDQAFQDVYVVLIECKYLAADDFRTGKVLDLQKQLDLIVARSRYRDAEEICSRLYHLRNQAEKQIRPLMKSVDSQNRWWQVFWLIEEREGRIISIVQQTVSELSNLMAHVDIHEVATINVLAGRQAEEIRRALAELRSLSNEILGLSGNEGLLELTADRQELMNRSILINRGTLSMSRDSYTAGQAVAMGPGAHAHDMTFQQIWNRSASDINLAELAQELSALRSAMRSNASEPEHDMSIGEIAAAEKAAKEEKGAAALEHLKRAGNWALDIATKIGVGVATAAIKTALGV